MDQKDITYLTFLAGLEEYGLLQSHLQAPFIPWEAVSSSDTAEIYQSLSELMHALSNQRASRWIVELRLLTEFLLFADSIPVPLASWIRSRIDLHQYLPAMDWKTAESGRWHPVPLVLVLSEVYLRYFIVGYVPEGPGKSIWPTWVDNLLDETAKNTIERAAHGAAKLASGPAESGLFCYPLTVANQSVQIKGTSLGLPLAIGFVKVLTGIPISADLIASGAVDENGSVFEVDALEQKTAFAARQGFKVFIYPAENAPLIKPASMDLLPAADLEEAWMFSTLYAPGKAGELNMLSQMLKDPQVFVNHLDSMDHKWIHWARRQGRCKKVLERIFNSGELFQGLVEKLEKCVEKGDLSKGEALAGFIPYETIPRLKEMDLPAAFRWCSLNITLANHRGRVKDSEKWGDLADSLVESASKTGKIENIADFYNRKFVTLHNYFRFEPELPEHLLKIVNHLEDTHRRDCEIGCPTNLSLGSLYGTIAQNFGFCGPVFLTDVEKYANSACKTFGEEACPDTFRDQWLRQFNYLIYAYLDAGRYEKAEESLLAYLEVKTGPEIRQKLSNLTRWQHAVLARFLADTNRRHEQKYYFDWSLKNKRNLVKQGHPWQLWIFNMARIAQAIADAEKAFQLYCESLDLCLSGKNGPTVNVMALLPLSGLWRLGRLDKINIQIAQKSVQDAVKTLNPEYFKLLYEDDFTTILEIIWQQPQSLFPFTYR